MNKIQKRCRFVIKYLNYITSMNEINLCGEPLYSEVDEANTTSELSNNEYGFAFKVRTLPRPEEKIYFLPPSSTIYSNTINNQENQYESIELLETQTTIKSSLQPSAYDLEAKRSIDKTLNAKNYNYNYKEILFMKALALILYLIMLGVLILNVRKAFNIYDITYAEISVCSIVFLSTGFLLCSFFIFKQKSKKEQIILTGILFCSIFYDLFIIIIILMGKLIDTFNML